MHAIGHEIGGWVWRCSCGGGSELPDWRWGPRRQREPSEWRWVCVLLRWPWAWTCLCRRPDWPGWRHLWTPARISSGSGRPRCSRSSARSRPARRSTRGAQPAETDAWRGPRNSTVQPGRFSPRLRVRLAQTDECRHDPGGRWDRGREPRKKVGNYDEKKADCVQCGGMCVVILGISKGNIPNRNRPPFFTAELPKPHRSFEKGKKKKKKALQRLPLRLCTRLPAAAPCAQSGRIRPLRRGLVAPGWAVAVLGADSCECAPPWYCALPPYLLHTRGFRALALCCCCWGWWWARKRRFMGYFLTLDAWIQVAEKKRGRFLKEINVDVFVVGVLIWK